MTEPAIVVEGLGKRYRLGRALEQPDTLIGRMRELVAAPWRNLQALRKLDRFQEDEAPDVLWALRDVSFEVARGEVLGVIGRNGAGKSTLLKLLARITEPTEGRAILNGRVASLLEVGTGFHPELTGRENIFLNGTLLGMTRREVERKFDDIVDFSGVSRFIDTPVKRYSSGMSVRLAFSVAAHLDPEILLIDEVLSVGDYGFRQRSLGKMQQILDEGRTIVFVSHNLGAVNELCDRALLLEKGTVLTVGGCHHTVQEFLGLFQGGGAGKVAAAASFDEEPDREINILSVRLDARHQPVPLCEPLSVEVTYRVNGDLEGSVLSLVLYRDGQPLFRSFDTDTDPARLQSRPDGRYRCSVRLPVQILAPGHYTISVGAGIANQRLIERREHVLSFDIEDTTADASLKGYTGPRSGLVRTELDWNQQPVETT